MTKFDPDETIDLLAVLVVSIPIMDLGFNFFQSAVLATAIPGAMCVFVLVAGTKRIRKKESLAGVFFLCVVLLTAAVLASLAVILGLGLFEASLDPLPPDIHYD